MGRRKKRGNKDDWRQEGVAPVEDAPPPSRSQLKRDAKTVSRLALELVNTKPGKLQRLELDPELYDEIIEGQKMQRTARQRQLKHIAGFLRNEDWRAIQAALAQAE